MSSNLPSESPKHRIEFTGNSAPKKRRKPRKPPPKWIVGWFGYLLFLVAGATLGGTVAVASIWELMTITDDAGSPLGAIFALSMGAIVGAAIGSVVGLFIWLWLLTLPREAEEIE